MTKALEALDPAQICAKVKSASANHLMHYIKLPSRLSGKLTPAQLAVLFALASFGPAGESLEISTAEISECSRVCRKNVKRTIKELEQMTLISTQENPGFASSYVVHGAKS